jgi:sporulation protein YlmC with PRC-barrel domain
MKLSTLNGKALRVLAISAFATTVLVAANTGSVFSQETRLVKVDVSVVDKGLRTSQLKGKAVVNETGEKIGSIDDVIVGRDNNSLFAVLQVGGFLGIGSRLVAVPYNSLKIDDGGKKVMLPGASKVQLKELAEFRYLG